MVFLPGLIFCFMLKTCLGASTEVPVQSVDKQTPKCPGQCMEETNCFSTLNETDCGRNLVCCLDNLETVESNEFIDSDLLAQGISAENEILEETEDLEFIEDDSPEAVAYQTYEDSSSEDAPDGYRYVYSEESDDLVMQQKKPEGVCPGVCVSSDEIEACDYIVSSDMCPETTTCCLSQTDVENIEQPYEIDDDPHIITRRQSYDDDSEYLEDQCPGSCVHPSHAMFCDQILQEFTCPLNALCCKKKPSVRSLSGNNALECSGQCLPPHIQGYCFPPNELILGPTSCPRGTACCTQRPMGNMIRPPTITRMQHPGYAVRQSYDGPDVLGHLAVDDTGTVFKVSNNGQVAPLPRLTHFDHVRSKFIKQMSYPRPDGEIVIYSDASGTLYQQFFSRSKVPNPQTRPVDPTVRRPIHQLDSQTSQPTDELQMPEEIQKDEAQQTDSMEDVVIPDEDEVPVPITSTPVHHDDKASRPACPGSCMSYFLRFTCFRGYAIYDGFTCPGRSVCCARLEDIEDHEQYLKSLSPYFNAAASSRDPSLPRCGVKGTRDTPRVMGGKESVPGKWCWQVAVINVQNQYICGGALIDDSWVLTAAHCVAGPVRENEAIFIRVGVTDLKSPEDNKRGQTVRILSTFVHHNYNSLNLDNNIALLRLKKPVELTSNVCVICLPTSGHMPKEETKCTVTGYGFVSPGGDMSLRIREAEVPIIDDMECMSNVTEALTNPFIIPSSSFCAGGQGQQKDACQGDAGGPLACNIGGFHEIVGLVSWGLGCGRDDVPSIYVKVPSFMGWINQIISSSSFLLSLN